MFWRNAGAEIAHQNPQLRLTFAGDGLDQGDGHSAPRRAIFQRVLDQVLKQPQQFLAIAGDPGRRVRQIDVDRDLAFARQRLQAVRDLPETPAWIAGDREELLRLFENLVENALKYGASGGKVIVSLTSVTAGEGAPEVRVMVRDFGPGIAPEHLPRLTERFYRVDVGDSRAQGGTGLGLSLVKHIVNRHRGRLLIESVPKKGATFTACFPQARTPDRKSVV